MPPQVILGACRSAAGPRRAAGRTVHRTAAPVQRRRPRGLDGTTVVEAVDPQTMVALTGDTALQTVADDATRRLTAALDSLPNRPTEEN